MYTPAAFAVEHDGEILEILRRTAFGHLVTHRESSDHESTDGSPEFAATALPFIVDDALTSVRAHFARANRHWKSIDGCEALLIVPSVDAYISPRWYASKAEHGKVVPTWNYEVVHLHGTLEIHDDAEWKLQVVTDLTEHNERAASQATQAPAWEVSDAPRDFIETKLRGIVGVQMNVTRVEGKRKMSQDKPEGDRTGPVRGLSESPARKDLEAAELMQSLIEGDAAESH